MPQPQPTPAVSERTLSIDHSTLTVSDAPPDQALVEIEMLEDQVQMPNGLAYDSGDTVLLSIAEVDQLAASGEGVFWQNNGLVGSVQAEGSVVSIAVEGADGDDAITNAATNQYTATATYANGDTEEFDEVNSADEGVVWAVVHVSGTPPVATIDGDGLLTAHGANDGTVQVTATLRGKTGTSAVLTVA